MKIAERVEKNGWQLFFASIKMDKKKIVRAIQNKTVD